MLVEVESAVFGYSNRPVVRVARLALHAGRCLGVFGPNGSGKTTLVRGLVGLLPPLEGTVRADPVANAFGYLPQHRAMELNWPMSALDVACLASSARSRMGWTGSSLPRVRHEMETLGVAALESRQFSALSGGEQQRVLLAGALAPGPRLLVLDEPTDGLDLRSRGALLERLRVAIKQKALCTILVSHEPRDLLAIADDLLVLEPSDDPAHPSPAVKVDASHLAEHVMGTHAGGAE